MSHLIKKAWKNLWWTYGTLSLYDRRWYYYPIARKNRVTGMVEIYLTESNCGLETPYQWYGISHAEFLEFNKV